MQTNEFENKIQAKLEGFELTPSGEVWEQVAAQIAGEKKRRRILFIWFFTGLMLAGGAAGWFLTNSHTVAIADSVSPSAQQNSSLQNIAVNKDKQAIAPAQKSDAEKSIAADQEKQGKAQPEPIQNSLKVASAPTLKRTTQQIEVIAKSRTESLEILNEKNTDEPVAKEEKKLKETVIAANIEQQKSDVGSHNKNVSASVQNDLQASVVTSSSPNEMAGAGIVDTVATIAKVNERRTHLKDTAVTSSANKTSAIIKKANIKKVSFGFAAYAGLSDNVSGFPIISSQEKSMDYVRGPSNSTGGTTTTSIAPLDYSSAFSFGLGVFVARPLSQRIGISAGISYHQYIARSSVGSAYSAQTALFDSVQNQYVYSSSFYSDGNSTKHSNKYRSVELPVNLSLRLNKNNAKPFDITAGISPGFDVGSSALYANSNVGAYYDRKDQFARFRLSAQAGFLYTFIHASKCLLAVGPAVQYGITNLTRSSSGSLHQHLLFTGIKTTISIK